MNDADAGRENIVLGYPSGEGLKISPDWDSPAHSICIRGTGVHGSSDKALFKGNIRLDQVLDVKTSHAKFGRGKKILALIQWWVKARVPVINHNTGAYAGIMVGWLLLERGQPGPFYEKLVEKFPRLPARSEFPDIAWIRAKPHT